VKPETAKRHDAQQRVEAGSQETRNPDLELNIFISAAELDPPDFRFLVSWLPASNGLK